MSIVEIMGAPCSSPEVQYMQEVRFELAPKQDWTINAPVCKVYSKKNTRSGSLKRKDRMQTRAKFLFFSLKSTEFQVGHVLGGIRL